MSVLSSRASSSSSVIDCTPDSDSKGLRSWPLGCCPPNTWATSQGESCTATLLNINLRRRKTPQGVRAVLEGRTRADCSCRTSGEALGHQRPLVKRTCERASVSPFANPGTGDHMKPEDQSAPKGNVRLLRSKYNPRFIGAIQGLTLGLVVSDH